MGDTEDTSDGVSFAELQLAARNHGLPLEALRWPVTPVGLHYLLTHYDVPMVDSDGWRLEMSGRVRRPLGLSLADLRARPRHHVTVTMECAGNGRALLTPRAVSQPWILEAIGTAEWSGTLLGPLLEEAGLLDDVCQVVFGGLDRGVENGVEQHYARALDVDEVRSGEALLADEMNGQPLLPQHGAPVRLVVPGWYGMTNVKWLAEIIAVDEPFTGYQQTSAYRLRAHEDDAGTPLTRTAPRSLMVPPGVPDFLTRRRFVPTGRHDLFGRAWSGTVPIEWVHVSTDGGASWAPAELETTTESPWAWRGWSYAWTVDTPGDYELCCRARDAAGDEQPLQPRWNVGGYANNAVQRVPVEVQPED